MIKIKGLNELTKKLDDLSQRASDLHGSHEVPLTELLTPAFLAKCSQFLSPDEMFAASGFEVKGPEDFKAIRMRSGTILFAKTHPMKAGMRCFRPPLQNGQKRGWAFDANRRAGEGSH